MKAYIVNKYGKTGQVEKTDVPEPIIKDNEVLVEIHSAGVNLLDSLVRNGDFKVFLPYKLPIINGHDLSGIVKRVGSKVSQFRPGDEVYSRVRDFHIGTFAESIAVNENDLAMKPKNLSMEEAASLPLVALTAWQALVEIAKIRKGQKVFIQAGSGGVGTIAIQLAKHLGAYVATTTSTANVDWVKSLGADQVIDYKKYDFSMLLRDYDVVLHSNRDPKILESSLKILRKGGTLVSLTGPPTPAFANEVRVGFHFNILAWILSMKARKLAKNLQVNFVFLFMKADGNQLTAITKLINDGIIKPVVDKVFPFSQTNDALSYVETGRAKGKVVIKIK